MNEYWKERAHSENSLYATDHGAMVNILIICWEQIKRVKVWGENRPPHSES